MPRYVILTHDHPFPHWDLLLEWGAACRTWRLLTEPDVGRVVPAESLPDHKLKYLDYAGPVSGGRGTVMRWDWGNYSVVTNQPALQVQLEGQRGLTAAACDLHEVDCRWQF